MRAWKLTFIKTNRIYIHFHILEKFSDLCMQTYAEYTFLSYKFIFLIYHLLLIQEAWCQTLMSSYIKSVLFYFFLFYYYFFYFNEWEMQRNADQSTAQLWFLMLLGFESGILESRHEDFYVKTPKFHYTLRTLLI